MVVANFTPVPWEEYRLGVPEALEYAALLSSDDPAFGGAGPRTDVPWRVADVPASGRDHSIVLTLPPMSVLFLAPADRDSRQGAESPGKPVID